MNFNSKIFYFLIITICILACDKDELQKSIDKPDVEEPKSVLTQLNYPSGKGSSGDMSTGVLGYGYDCTGLCDTLSVRNKVFDLKENYIMIAWPFSSHIGVSVSGYGCNNVYEIIESESPWGDWVDYQDTLALAAHIKSLLNYGLNENFVADSCGYAYFSTERVFKRYRYYLWRDETKEQVTDECKKDFKELNIEEIVEKYGTHAIKEACAGSRWEILYKCNSYSTKGMLYKRMKEYFGFVPFTIAHSNKIYKIPDEEELIFNAIGTKNNSFGILNITNNNADSIHIDIYNAKHDETTYQLMKIGEEGLIPLYKFFDASEKQQELKEYIDNIVETNSLL
ncbi:MAC/perforin domain-containing protein [Labilibacter marinus]|uniref:MAC/perforin domain-containing protein n=1 Tax=Labilibacter marinus TaxID=1477105 RepID=UPI00082A63AF|nr:MAC/perforin domain-containing protein [Labilibacter marinus]